MDETMDARRRKALERYALLGGILYRKGERGAVVRQVTELAASELELDGGATGHISRATFYRRWEVTGPMALWQGDASPGPWLHGQRLQLYLWLDVFSGHRCRPLPAPAGLRRLLVARDRPLRHDTGDAR